MFQNIYFTIMSFNIVINNDINTGRQILSYDMMGRGKHDDY